MTHPEFPHEFEPEPETLPEPTETYTPLYVKALKCISDQYNLPNLLAEVTPWFSPNGLPTERAIEVLQSIRVGIDSQTTNAYALFESAVTDLKSIAEENRQRAQTLGSKIMRIITGRFS